jgi:hypothetical protein
MPRYFFNARGPNRYVADYKGVDLDSIEAARDVARQTILDIASDPVELRRHEDWTMEVTNDGGRTILTMPFSEAAQEPGSRQA